MIPGVKVLLLRGEMGLVAGTPVNKFLMFPFSSVVYVELAASSQVNFKRTTQALKSYSLINSSCDLTSVDVYICSDFTTAEMCLVPKIVLPQKLEKPQNYAFELDDLQIKACQLGKNTGPMTPFWRA